jgi:hypothetical protein
MPLYLDVHTIAGRARPHGPVADDLFPVREGA